ncbi:MAG: SpoIIE family protein phosphatase [Leptospiraceae bacterium]|nr:SpoIIE family protein phosphatase [Leptospiraceae bacterium]MCP5502008.1 SpoIIE family protein phosphatase [Leptospiraceae bacterium]
MKQDTIHSHIKENSFKFSRKLETLYQKDYLNRSLKIMRIAIVLGLLLYAAFGLLDTYFAPDIRNKIWFIRYAIVCPMLILVFTLSYFSFFENYMQSILVILSLTAGFGILAMLYLITEVETGMSYYAGLILVLMWAYTFLRMRFLYASFVGWSLVIAYQIIAIYAEGVLDSPVFIKEYIRNNFFFISANIIGMATSYQIELSTRIDFLQRQLILEKQDEIIEKHNILKERNTTIENELHMARNIQSQLIPTQSPWPQVNFIYRPMDAVGGDLFDFLRFREKSKIGIFLSDVSGHGVPAALITSMVKTAILQSKRFTNDPAGLLIFLNELLLHQTAGHFITAFYGIYDTETKEFIFSNAGHNPPFLIQQNKIEYLHVNKAPPLAVYENDFLEKHSSIYKNNYLNLEKINKLLFYTDGLVEARKETEVKRFFYEEIEKVLSELSSLSGKEFIDELFKRLLHFKGNDNFMDDICIINLDIDSNENA